MKNLFSPYRFNSVKKFILNRAIILGSFFVILLTAIILENHYANLQIEKLIEYTKHIASGNKTYSEEQLNLLTSGSSFYSILLWALILILLITSLSFFSSQMISYFLKSLNRIKEFSQVLASGDLSTRITGIQNKDEIGEICWELNDTVDQFEALVKELTTSVEYISNRKFFRPVLSKGMNGTFSLRLKKVDQALKDYSNTLIQERKDIEQKAEYLLKAMNSLSKGDLTQKMDVINPEEVMCKLSQGFNDLVDGIKNIITEVNEAVNITVSVSNQIAASIEEMAAGAEEQNRQTSEIASSIDEMSKTVSETTKNTTAAAESAKESGILAEDGSKVVKKAVQAMDSIADIVSSAVEKVVALGKNSDKIGEIIQVIEEIADQTNLLALNAAIEAARAGEHGRGFAVVADEVRKLAERTTSATQEITGMISQIQKDTNTVVNSIESGNHEVQEGRNLNEKAGKAIHNIVEMANKVVDEINQVATASEEQSLTSSQISQNIITINNVASESLAGIHHMANAATDLNNTTENLKVLVERFKFDKTFNREYDNKFTSKNKITQLT